LGERASKATPKLCASIESATFKRLPAPAAKDLSPRAPVERGFQESRAGFDTVMKTAVPSLSLERISRTGRLFSGRLPGASSRRSVCVHRQGELKRGAVGRFAVADSRPSWASTIERQIESPMPMPLDLVVKKRLNSRSACLSGDPDAAIRHTYEHSMCIVLA
jgi:hypothetical protein